MYGAHLQGELLRVYLEAFTYTTSAVSWNPCRTWVGIDIIALDMPEISTLKLMGAGK